MEKYARQAVSEGVKNAEDLHVGGDSELYRVLNLHYNRNNHIEVWGPQVREVERYLEPKSVQFFLLFSLLLLTFRFFKFTRFFCFNNGAGKFVSWVKFIFEIYGKVRCVHWVWGFGWPISRYNFNVLFFHN